jgi:hypothetical protein
VNGGPNWDGLKDSNEKAAREATWEALHELQRGWPSNDGDAQSKETHRADLPPTMQDMQRQRTGISERQLTRPSLQVVHFKVSSIAFMA